MKKTVYKHNLSGICGVVLCLALCLALCACGAAEKDGGKPDAENGGTADGTNGAENAAVFSFDDIMSRSENAQEWADENLEQPETTLINRIATDFLPVGDTVYIAFQTTETLLENGDSGGPTDTQKTFQLEKVENGKRSILANDSEENEHLMFVKDGENLLLYYIPSLEFSEWTRLIFTVTYQSGSAEEIDYTFDEKEAPAPAFYCGTLIYKLRETELKSVVVRAFDRENEEATATVELGDGYVVSGYRAEPDGEYQKIESSGKNPEFFYPEYFEYAD